MRVLIAPDRFAGALSAPEAATAIATGWARAAPHDDLVLLPLSDGGPGFVDVLARGRDGAGAESRAVTVQDPLGRPATATLLLVDGGGGRTAYAEAAQACGLHLLAAGERDPTRTSSHGAGQLLLAALELGAQRIVVGVGDGVGDGGTHDAGAGLLSALGAGPSERLGRGGLALAGLAARDLAGLGAAVERLQGVELLAATDVDAPLLGLHGASAVFATRKGATPEQAQALEGALGHFADLAQRVRPPRPDLLSGRPRRLEREPGAGAGGGLGYALLLLGGRRVSGAAACLDALGFAPVLETADLVVTGAATFEGRSLGGTVVAEVADLALGVGVPTVVVAGRARVGRRQAVAAGVSGVYAVAESPAEAARALVDPAGALSERAARVARTWSPAP